MSSKSDTVEDDPEQMLAALRGVLPTGAGLRGDCTYRTINVILSGEGVNYTRNPQDLKVMVYGGAGGKSEADI